MPQKYKQFLNQQIKMQEKMEELKEYLQKEFDRSVHRKFRHLFEQWFSKLTDNQIMYYTAYMQGKKSPFVYLIDDNGELIEFWNKKSGFNKSALGRKK